MAFYQMMTAGCGRVFTNCLRLRRSMYKHK